LILLAVLAAVTVSAAGAAHDESRSVATTHLLQYTTLIVMEWLLVLFVWRGMRAAGTPFSAVIGSRWSSWTDAWKPILAAAVFWAVKTAVLVLVQRGLDAAALGRAADAERVAAWLLPETAIEAAVWVALSISAGFCEEVIYRGYLQRQFSAFTRHRVAGTALVAVVFGVLSQVTRTLRPGIVAHSVEDIVSGLNLRA
jgi:membrane protease YdiL (CAAX protease family)